MYKSMRQPTLQSLGLGSVHDIFRSGRLPISAADAVEKVFGPAGDRGCMVVSGASGIVGAGKTVQFASRLLPYGINVVALDFPGAPAGLARQYSGLRRSFGDKRAAEIMGSVTQLTYDGRSLPRQLHGMKPKFLLEAVPENLEIKRAHYEIFRKSFPGIDIRSVTSGFPSRELGVGIAHPAFPHEINKIFECVEETPSAISQMMWALGLIPVQVSDDWSFVLDVLFCGLMLSSCRYAEATNMPAWKIDKYVRRMLGPNPFRAHDSIGAKGATFLTWSCLDHLAKNYGKAFEPSPSLVEHKDSGQDWYLPGHFRPLVDWTLGDAESADLDAWILGAMFHYTSLMLHEKRASPAVMNIIGELCAQLRKGVLAQARQLGSAGVRALVERFHALYPPAASSAWYPEEFERMDTPEWQQLYVNAEHDGTVGVITIGRESYNNDVDDELNRAIDWLKSQGIVRVILSGDFHLSTQLVGADTTEFFAGIEEPDKGMDLCLRWAATARRLHDEFAVSVAFLNGKRCLGGMVELVQHCHYVVAVEDTLLGMPEVNLPVIPGMDGCHWLFRKTAPDAWGHVARMLLTGRPVEARNGVGWLVDFAGPLEDAIQTAWALAAGTSAIARRDVASGVLPDVLGDLPGLEPATTPAATEGRKAIVEAIRATTGVSLADAIPLQAKVAGAFFATPALKKGAIGSAHSKTVRV